MLAVQRQETKENTSTRISGGPEVRTRRDIFKSLGGFERIRQ
jgi:hypothetical protein